MTRDDYIDIQIYECHSEEQTERKYNSETKHIFRVVFAKRSILFIELIIECIFFESVVFSSYLNLKIIKVNFMGCLF